VAVDRDGLVRLIIAILHSVCTRRRDDGAWRLLERRAGELMQGLMEGLGLCGECDRKRGISATGAGIIDYS
jgi:hypothetical protein